MTAIIHEPADWASVTPNVTEVVLEVQEPPVSLQARSEHKNRLIAAVRELTKPCDFVFTNDVTVTIEWRVSEAERYESDATADVDNIIKPIADAISGEQGLLVNDCQIQSVNSYWVGMGGETQSVQIRVRAVLEAFKHRKASLTFLQFKDALCFPLDTSWGRSAMGYVGSSFKRMLDARDRFGKTYGNWGQARLMLPIQRMFHRSRVGKFPVILFEHFEQQYGPFTELVAEDEPSQRTGLNPEKD